jgi:hypothetical protein
MGDVLQEISSTSWGLDVYKIVEIIYDGAGSKLSIGDESYITGDLGIAGAIDLGFGFSRSDVSGARFALAEFKGFDQILTEDQRAAEIAGLKFKWDLP